MRGIVFVLCCLVFIGPVFATQETLISDKVEHGGYGGFNVKYTSIADQGGFFTSGEGAWLINRTFMLGGGGGALVSDMKASDFSAGVPGHLSFSYGGLKLGMILNSDALSHFIIHSLIGLGNLGYSTPSGGTNYESSLFVIEPGIDYEVNILPFFRMAFGLTYRLVSGVDNTPGLSNADLSNLSFGVTFKWGGFGTSES